MRYNRERILKTTADKSCNSIIKISADIATIIFNDSHTGLLQILNRMDLNIKDNLY